MEYKEETKKCPLCGKNMILRSLNVVLCSNPPQYPQEWWCGGCNVTEKGPTLRGVTIDEYNYERWEQENEANTPDSHS